MHLPTPLLLLPLLLTHSTSTASPSPPTYTTTTLSFDTLPPPPHGLSPLPTPFPFPPNNNIPINLTFSPRFSLFYPLSPSLANHISPHDRNCAFSRPNALLGSRGWEGGEGAGWEVERGEGRGFELVGMRVKPLDAPRGGGREVRVRGWRRGGGEGEKDEEGDGEEEVLEWSVVFPYGFWDMLEVRIEEFSGRRWDRLWKVEVSARYGEGGLDWEVCVDDLVVGFEGGGLDDGEGGEL